MQPKWHKLIESVHTFSQWLIPLLCGWRGQMRQLANRLPEVRLRTGNPDEKGGHALLLQGLPKALFREDGNADGGHRASWRVRQERGLLPQTAGAIH